MSARPLFLSKPHRCAASAAESGALQLAGPLRTAAAAAAGRPRKAAAAAQPAGLTADTDVGAAIHRACESLGRVPGAAEASLVQRLEENWYASAGDVAAMSDADAASLKLPLRLRAQIAALLAQQEGGRREQRDAAWASAAAPPASPTAAAHLLPEAAEVLVSEFLSGEAVVPPPAAGAGSGDSKDSSGGSAASSSSSSSSGKTILGPGSLIDHDLDTIPIEERRCPPVWRPERRVAEAPRLTKKGRGAPYALKAGRPTLAARCCLPARPPACARLCTQQASWEGAAWAAAGCACVQRRELAPRLPRTVR